MAVINEIKCARCDRKYSGVRSRCPYCGARRIGRGKYSEDSENAKGKMLIGVLILAVFLVGASILLFTTPADDDGDNDTIAADAEEDEEAGQHLELPPEPTPSPTPEPTPVAPPNVESIAIWVAPNSHDTRGDITISNGSTIDLTAKLEPVGIEESVTVEWWIDPDDSNVFEFEEVVGGIRVSAHNTGSAKLYAAAGDTEIFTWIRVN